MNYRAVHGPRLLSLLLELHGAYFLANAAKKIKRLQEEKDVRKSYEAYLRLLDIKALGNNRGGSRKILLAKTRKDGFIGFIIGSISTDRLLVLGKIGVLEDWFVRQGLRKMGIGAALYRELEKWFIGNGCDQIRSDTWRGNRAGIKAHRKTGFFVSGVRFGKEL